MSLPYINPDGNFYTDHREWMIRAGEADFTLEYARDVDYWERSQREYLVDLEAPGLPDVEDELRPLGPCWCRVYRAVKIRPGTPRPGAPGPGANHVLYLHGEGFIANDTCATDAVCHYLTALSGRIITNPHYKLAPEHPFPAAVNDALGMFDEMTKYGSPVSIVGDSTGATLVNAILQADGGKRRALTDSVVLICPAFAAPLSAQAQALDAAYPVSDAVMPYHFDAFAPRIEDRELPELNPFNGTFNDHPRTLVITADCDPYAEMGRRYAQTLAAAKGKVVHSEFAGEPHGFWRYPQRAFTARSALQFVAAFLCGR